MTLPNISDQLVPFKSKISLVLTKYLEHWKKKNAVFEFDEYLLSQAEDFVCSGKMFRGFLFYSVSQQLAPEISKAAIKQIAAAIELYGSAILMHDDIMDEDDLRRGKPTMHRRVQQRAHEQYQTRKPEHFGISAAVSLGDVLFFLAGDLISTASQFPADMRLKLLSESHTEMSLLGLAQVEDLYLAYTPSTVSKEQILSMYYGKTARYTAVWPIIMAGLVAEVSPQLRHELQHIAAKLGILYQLRDDYLGLFGNSAKTGKGTLSDIREGKKTLYYYYAQELPAEDQKTFFSWYGNPEVKPEEVTECLKFLEAREISKKVDKDIVDLEEESYALLAGSHLPSTTKTFLQAVIQFIVSRTH